MSRMPYAFPYRQLLESLGIDHEVLTWNRMREDGESKDRIHSFEYQPRSGLMGTLLGYLRYRAFVKSKIKATFYDGYILLGMQTGVLCFDLLGGHPYIQDVRDYSHENILPYQWHARNVLRQADLVCISSRGFERWLPSDLKYVLTHNTAHDWSVSTDSSLSNDLKIIAWIGQIEEGYVSALSKFIGGMQLYPSARLCFHGDGIGEDKLKAYSICHGLSNVEFFGRYQPSEKAQLIQNASFLLSTYGNHSPILTTALPNKLADACIYRRPIIVNDGTYLADVVREWGLGIVINLDNMQTIVNQLERYYEAAVFQKFIRNCDRFLAMMSENIESFQHRVTGTIISWADGLERRKLVAASNRQQMKNSE